MAVLHKENGMDMERMDLRKITPAMAKYWLGVTRDAGFINRALSRRLVEKYKKDMAAGQWYRNGETIKITQEGVVVDGQHRLTAIVDGNVTVEAWVCIGVRRPDGIDIGKNRLVSDFAAMSGVSNAKMVCVMAKLILRAKSENYNIVPSINDTLGFIAANNYGLQQAHKIGAQAFYNWRAASAGTLGAAYYLIAECNNPIDAAAFVVNVADGIGLPANSQRYVVRRSIEHGNTAGRIRRDNLTACAMLVKAWNAEVGNISPAKYAFVTTGTKAESFPNVRSKMGVAVSA